MISLLFSILLAPVFAETESIDFISTGVEKGWSVLVYTKLNGEVCKLKVKNNEILTDKISEWFEYVNTIKCATPRPE
jgi:hypothetical protein